MESPEGLLALDVTTCVFYFESQSPHCRRRFQFQFRFRLWFRIRVHIRFHSFFGRGSLLAATSTDRNAPRKRAFIFKSKQQLINSTRHYAHHSHRSASGDRPQARTALGCQSQNPHCRRSRSRSRSRVNSQRIAAASRRVDQLSVSRNVRGTTPLMLAWSAHSAPEFS